MKAESILQAKLFCIWCGPAVGGSPALAPEYYWVIHVAREWLRATKCKHPDQTQKKKKNQCQSIVVAVGEVDIHPHFFRDILKFHSGVGNFRFDVDVLPPRFASFGPKTSSAAPTSSHLPFIRFIRFKCANVMQILCEVNFIKRLFPADRSYLNLC